MPVPDCQTDGMLSDEKKTLEYYACMTRKPQLTDRHAAMFSGYCIEA